MEKEVQKIYLTKLQFVDSAKFIVSSLSNVKCKHSKTHDNVIMSMINMDMIIRDGKHVKSNKKILGVS